MKRDANLLRADLSQSSLERGYDIATHGVAYSPPVTQPRFGGLTHPAKSK